VRGLDDPLEDQTPLDVDEREGLLPASVSTQADLNHLEQANIDEAARWAFAKGHRHLLTDSFVRELHRRMFRHVWRWAGRYRKTLKNIGPPPERVPTAVRDLCADAACWVEGRVFPWDELAARFHHRLVAAHPFPNGNGRHARLMTDLLLRHCGRPVGSWGSLEAEARGETTEGLRARYLGALRSADQGDYAPLTAFLRS
jgi:Fic-DOC domain mobile mystery protein B